MLPPALLMIYPPVINHHIAVVYKTTAHSSAQSYHCAGNVTNFPKDDVNMLYMEPTLQSVRASSGDGFILEEELKGNLLREPTLIT